MTDSVSSSKFLSGLVAYLKSIHYDENGDTSLVKLSLQDSLFGAKLQLISPYFWQLEVELAKKSCKGLGDALCMILCSWSGLALSGLFASTICDQTGG